MESASFSQLAAPGARRFGSGTARRRVGATAYLKGRKGLLLLAAALGIVGLSAGWTWFGTAAVLPLLSALPCAAMMAMCMKGHSAGGNAPGKPDAPGGTEPGGSP